LETTAGQGSSIGYKLEHLASIMDWVEHKKRVGVCLDTCHMYSAGYDIKGNYEKVVESIEGNIGIERVKVIHLNDSKNPLESRIDRHEHIGEGSLGIKIFRTLVNDKRWANLPGILETPGGEEDYRRNLGILKGLRVEK
jgi:deoxyribonuclease-4